MSLEMYTWVSASVLHDSLIQFCSFISGMIPAVTGANAGIGYTIAEFLASRGGRVYMVCRNRERGEAARDKIAAAAKSDRVHMLCCDCSLEVCLRVLLHRRGHLVRPTFTDDLI